MEERLGAQVQTSWGMTELSPLGTIASPDCAVHRGARLRPAASWELDLKLTDAAGVALPKQRGTVGHLKVKGASVLERYFKAATSAVDAEGYLDTGDLASIDESGNVTICGRSKDLIKSGGEWINPAELEDIAGTHPAVGLAAVIARTDAEVGRAAGADRRVPAGPDAATHAPCSSFSAARWPSWWLPDEIVEIDAMPLAATGKIDKNQLRADYANGKLSVD